MVKNLVLSREKAVLVKGTDTTSASIGKRELLVKEC